MTIFLKKKGVNGLNESANQTEKREMLLLKREGKKIG